MSKKLEDLNKINFWDAMKVLYPKSYVNFNNWIDEYKVDNNWKHLFNPAYTSEHISGHAETRLTKDDWPKFHDLPMFMQVGIFYQYLGDQSNDMDTLVVQSKEIIMDFFKMLEPELK